MLLKVPLDELTYEKDSSRTWLLDVEDQVFDDMHLVNTGHLAMHPDLSKYGTLLREPFSFSKYNEICTPTFSLNIIYIDTQWLPRLARDHLQVETTF